MSDRYKYRAYCDICNEPSEWFESERLSKDWRESHFTAMHSGNPMKKANCRIQRDADE
jgi:hypothetical protein